MYFSKKTKLPGNHPDILLDQIINQNQEYLETIRGAPLEQFSSEIDNFKNKIRKQSIK